MTRRTVITWGDPRLKATNQAVGAWTPEMDALVGDMWETTLAEEGLGLAAPQIGLNLQLAVVDLSCGQDPSQRIILINPEIIEREGSQVGQEGCLSVPGIHENLERPKKVKVRSRRPDGSTFEIEGEDLLARALCHEIDHLNGKLFVEYYGPVKRNLIQRKYRKLNAEHE